MPNVGLVREAGGYGDIICMDTAAAFLRSWGYTVAAYVPDEFVDTASHLSYVQCVYSLGPVSKLQEIRRPRDWPIDYGKYPYLKEPVETEDLLVDLYCPGFLYERSSMRELEYSRAQLMAIAAGATEVADAVPVWDVTAKETKLAKAMVESMDIPIDHVAVCVRGTCPCRTYPTRFAQELFQLLVDGGYKPVFYDCIQPYFDIPDSITRLVGVKYPVMAAIMKEYANMVITVDSSLMHLSAALDIPGVVIFGSTSPTSIQSYPKAVGVVPDPEVVPCSIPCNYSVMKGWNKRKCRSIGCNRIMNVFPAVVVETAREHMEKYSAVEAV